MKSVVAWDTETALFRPGVMAPELVCVSWQTIWADGTRGGGGLVNHDKALDLVRRWLLDPECILVGQNIQYDVAVLCAEYPELLPLFFEAYEAGRITDTKWREILLDTAFGRYRWHTRDGKRVRVSYGLADLAFRYLGRNLWKEGGPRTTYGALRGVPIEQWPAEHVKYAKDDAVTTLDVYLEQEKVRKACIAGDYVEYGFPAVDPLVSEFREAYSYFALHLASVWGLRTDGAKVDILETETRRAQEIVKARLVEAGLVRTGGKGKKEGSRDTKKAAEYMVAVCEAKNLPVPRTPTGAVCLDADACELADDDLLNDYAEYTTLGTLLSKDVKLLKAGVEFPVHTTFGFAESDRTTSSRPNIQNFSRSA